MSQKYLVQCKRCGWNELSFDLFDRCPQCKSEKMSASIPTVMDLKNPSDRHAIIKADTLAFPKQPEVPSFMDTEYQYQWSGFKLAGMEVVSDPYMAPGTAVMVNTKANNAHVSEMAEWNPDDITVTRLAEMYNKAVAGMGMVGKSAITAEYKPPEPKPKIERVEFPTERKIILE